MNAPLNNQSRSENQGKLRICVRRPNENPMARLFKKSGTLANISPPPANKHEDDEKAGWNHG